MNQPKKTEVQIWLMRMRERKILYNLQQLLLLLLLLYFIIFERLLLEPLALVRGSPTTYTQSCACRTVAGLEFTKRGLCAFMLLTSTEKSASNYISVTIDDLKRVR